MITKLFSKTRELSLKKQALAVITAVLAAVALPELFHLLGAYYGAGTSLGEVFLPMHLPIILVGFLAGPIVGGIAGIAAPIVSFLISGMPTSVMLPFIMVEVFAYGFSAGLLSSVKMNGFFKVLAVQAAGRAVRTLAVLFGFFALGSNVAPITAWSSIVTALPGIILQWIILPLLLFRISYRGENGN